MPQLDPPGQGTQDQSHAQALQDKYEHRPDPQALTGHDPTGPNAHLNSKTGVDYEPHPERSMQVSPVRQEIIKRITSLYSGSASTKDILVYARDSVYDDPLSYCDTRYKIAGQWWGIPILFASSKTTGTEVVESTPKTLIFKMRQEYTPKILGMTKPVNSLISLTLEPDPDSVNEKELEGKMVGEGEDRFKREAWMETVKYHKDMWNEKDYR